MPNVPWHSLACRKPERAPGIITDERLQSSCKLIYPRCHCRINLRESKETPPPCSNIPWHVYILPINNPRKDRRHLFADSVFGLEIQKINKDEARVPREDRRLALLLRKKERCEGRGNENADITVLPSGTGRLIRTDDRRSFRTAAALLLKTAADARESSLDAWTPLDLQHTPKSQNRHIHHWFKKVLRLTTNQPRVEEGRSVSVRTVRARWVPAWLYDLLFYEVTSTSVLKSSERENNRPSSIRPLSKIIKIFIWEQWKWKHSSTKTIKQHIGWQIWELGVCLWALWSVF